MYIIIVTSDIPIFGIVGQNLYVSIENYLYLYLYSIVQLTFPSILLLVSINIVINYLISVFHAVTLCCAAFSVNFPYHSPVLSVPIPSAAYTSLALNCTGAALQLV
jgi:hypothetical protein